jgi:hypothetical protein
MWFYNSGKCSCCDNRRAKNVQEAEKSAREYLDAMPPLSKIVTKTAEVNTVSVAEAPHAVAVQPIHKAAIINLDPNAVG